MGNAAKKERRERKNRPCALCLKPPTETEPLTGRRTLSDSHIVPAFVTRPLRRDDHKHRLASSSSGGGAPRLSTSELQIPLLCALCETRFHQWETKIAPIYIRWMEASDSKAVCSGVVADLRVHWQSFRALLLSVFWRLSAAYTYEYRNLKLPPEDQESLRKILLSEPDPSLTVWNISAVVMTPWDESRGLVSTGTLAWAPLELRWHAAGVVWTLHKNHSPGIGLIDESLLGPWPSRPILDIWQFRQIGVEIKRNLHVMSDFGRPGGS